MPSVWLCCKYFCTGIDAHPCYSPLNWTNRLSPQCKTKGSSMTTYKYSGKQPDSCLFQKVKEELKLSDCLFI